MFRSFFRFIFTLGGLIGSKVDEGTDSLVTSPAGIKAAYRQARTDWTGKYKEVRDAVSQILMVLETKKQEFERLAKEETDLETKKRGAIERFKATNDAKYQQAFQDAHNRVTQVDARQTELEAEIKDLDGKVGGYKLKLTEMQREINGLDQKEAEAIADIVSSSQIVQLNDRLSNLSTTLNDQSLQAIEKQRQKVKASAKLSDQLSGTDAQGIDRELMTAGTTTAAMDEFNKMLAASEMKDKESKAPGAEAERTM